MKNLVAYFSATGITKNVANLIANAIGADIHEIEPSELYTSKDLDWMDPNSRSSLEAQDKYIRPEIKKYINNMAEYDNIFVGFPIWWYTAPNIIFSFLESYDFSGKTIIPFATSGSSVYGSTNDDLSKFLTKNATLKDGKLCSFIDNTEIINWAKSLV